MNKSYDESYNWLKSRDFMRKERRDLTITLSILATEIVLIIIHYLN
jgi:hypothetical protein